MTPSFCKTYARIGEQIQTALNHYKEEVAADTFPGDSFSPYKLKNEEERKQFAMWAKEQCKRIEAQRVEEEGGAKGAHSPSQSQSADAADETIKVY